MPACTAHLHETLMLQPSATLAMLPKGIESMAYQGHAPHYCLTWVVEAPAIYGHRKEKKRLHPLALI